MNSVEERFWSKVVKLDGAVDADDTDAAGLVALRNHARLLICALRFAMAREAYLDAPHGADGPALQEFGKAWDAYRAARDAAVKP